MNDPLKNNTAARARLRAALQSNQLLNEVLDEGYVPSRDAELKTRLLRALHQKKDARPAWWIQGAAALLLLALGLMTQRWVQPHSKSDMTIAEPVPRVGPRWVETRVSDTLVVSRAENPGALLTVSREPAKSLVVETSHPISFEIVATTKSNPSFEVVSTTQAKARTIERMTDWELLSLPRVASMYGVPDGPKRLILYPNPRAERRKTEPR